MKVINKKRILVRRSFLKAVFFEVHDWEQQQLEAQLGKGHHYYLNTIQKTNMDEWRDAEILCVFIKSEVTKEIIDSMPNLKAVVTRSTGYNHIDQQALKEKNIPLLNVPTYGENTVAEHAFALILNLSRKVHKSYLRTLQGDFRIEDLRGFDLEGKTLGVVGGGHIGMHVVKIARGFGMNVLVSTRHPDHFLEGVLNFKYVENEEIFRQADIISLHVPLVPQTTHLINKEAIAQMRDGVILINTARGEIIDTQALLEGLQSGKIGGAGLDVIEGEKLVMEEVQLHKDENHKEQWKLLHEDKQILQMPNVVFTPHNAFNSQEALERILNTSARNVRAILEDDLVPVKKNLVRLEQ